MFTIQINVNTLKCVQLILEIIQIAQAGNFLEKMSHLTPDESDAEALLKCQKTLRGLPETTPLMSKENAFKWRQVIERNIRFCDPEDRLVPQILADKLRLIAPDLGSATASSDGQGEILLLA
ncbi:MAG: hypothetical protein QG551_109 [Patescibacteria group bacterium]|jgi:hypothetical protein|nr:hypothetical protein [Patescibacteria group bacterium]